MKYTKPFKDLSKKDADIAGGKGASLGEMLNANIPVPDGFVVLSTTFDEFLHKADLIQEIDAILESVDHKTVHSIDGASEKIQELIKRADMPDDIKTEIESQFAILDSEFVAVRSSATAEDGADHAWAGQLDSYLNTTQDTLLEKVQHCWASLFTPRAIFYRFEKGLDTTKISVAVVVQKMVNSEKSGIAFSVHPVTEDRNQIIIEAGFGLGEAIVSGSVTPDSYVISKQPREIIDINVSNQTRAMYRKPGGGNEWLDIPEKGNTQVFTDSEILELSEIIMTIENHYGFPCDIEWAFEVGKFYIVQSRPITTLSEVVGPKIAFEKAYTRDTTMIIQQGWNACVTNPFYASGTNPFTPPVIHYMNDGVIEIWENEKATQWIMDSVQDLIKSDETKLITLVDQYEKDLIEIKEYWTRGLITDLDEFVKYVDRVFVVMKGFDCMYFPSVDERTPAHIRERVLKLRDVDTYFDSNDKLMRASLIALYPELKGYENCILKSEIKNPPSLEILKARKKSFVVIGEEFAEQTTIREYLAKHSEYRFHIEIPPADSSTLIGQIGNKGYAKGIVRVMKRKEQIGEAQEGDIIVSTMTTPDFVPAMQKAAAIITDEGGITCHAAIVARELNKPCVIGTKFATEILMDGDEVEVDADNGVVRIITTVSQKQDKSDTVSKLNLPDTSWIRKSAEGYFHLTFPFIQASTLAPTAKKYPGQHAILNLVQDDIITVYLNTDVLRKIREEFFNIVHKDPEYLEKIKKEYYEAIVLYEKTLSNLNQIELEDLSDNDLSLLYNDFFENYVNVFKYFCTLGEAISHQAIEYMNPIFEKKLGDSFQEIFPIITHPSKPSFIEEEALDRNVLVQEFKQKGSIDDELKSKIEVHAEKYFYISNNYLKGIKLDVDFFSDQVLKTDIIVRDDSVLEKKKEYIKNIGFSDEELFLLKMVDECFKLIDDRKKNMMKASYYQLKFLGELEKRTKIPLMLLKWSVQPEYRALLDKTFPESILLERSQGAVSIVNDDSSFTVISGDSYKKISEYFSKQFEIKQEDKSIIRGIPASSGKFVGKVKILLRIEDINKVKDGDVLVASMTRPEMIPAMKVAGAFVTNEGGITCHAAIVARELNKPCVIGTKFATEILKDGDDVEVDANNGVVRILNDNKLIELESPELKDIDPKNFTFYGMWKNDILSSAFWQNCLNQDLVKEIGLDINDLGSSSLLGGNFLVKNEVENHIRGQIKKKISEKDKNFFDNLKKVTDKICKDSIEFGKKIQDMDITRENTELIFDQLKKINLFWYLGASHLVNGSEEMLAEQVVEEKFPADKVFEIIPQVITPIHEQQQDVKRLKKLVADKTLPEIKKSESLMKELQHHADTYYWIEILNFIGDLLTVDRLYDQIKSLKDENHSPVSIDIPHLSEKLEFRAYCMYVSGYVKQLTAEYFSMLSGKAMPYFKGIASKLGLEYREFTLLTPAEILLGLDGEISKEKLKEQGVRRRDLQWFLLSNPNGEPILIENKHDIKILEDSMLPKTDSSLKTVRGITAYHGKVTGEVVVIMNTDEFHKMKPGYILVTTMTTPDFVILMQQASAIVTDIGGLLCHAAIVSREIKTPCIIGTKNGTQILKDGDMVEVDADKGIVTKIS